MLFDIQSRLDHLTKPVGSLGRLEEMVLRLGSIQGSSRPHITRPTMLVFAADHGAARHGLSAYPQSVTVQMVANFLSGGAAIAVLAEELGWQLGIVDAGLATEVPLHPQLFSYRVGPGTADFCSGPAMSAEQLDLCLLRGAELVRRCVNQGCSLLGLGEMGIANTSSAALLSWLLSDLPLQGLIGPGTGVSGEILVHKRRKLQQAAELHRAARGEPRAALQAVGGFEIAMLVGAFLAAARSSLPVVVDGFIVTAALLAARQLDSRVDRVCLLAHRSGEPGHSLQLGLLPMQPYLDLDLRLGEGSGGALLLPLLKAALATYERMASFEEAGVDHAVTA